MTYIYLILIIVFALIGVVATIQIANSKENKEENPSYDKKTGEKWIRLTIYYVAATAVGLIVFLIYISN